MGIIVGAHPCGCPVVVIFVMVFSVVMVALRWLFKGNHKDYPYILILHFPIGCGCNIINFVVESFTDFAHHTPILFIGKLKKG